MFQRKWWVACASTLLFAAVSASAQAQQRGGTLVFTVPASDFPSRDGHQEETFAVIHPIAPHYSLLIRLDPTDPKAEKLEGDLAEDWTVSEDRRTYTFHLRRGVRFHDGSVLTARDVVASILHFVAPPKGVNSPRKSYYSMIESVTAEGDSTVVIRLKFPTAAFLPALASPYNFIYSAKLLKQDPNWFKTHVMGSGPFRFRSEQRGVGGIAPHEEEFFKIFFTQALVTKTWVGVRNPTYFKKGLPYLDAYEAVFTPSEKIEIQGLRTGHSLIQFRGFPPSALDEVRPALQAGLVETQESVWNCSLFAIPNSHKAPFNDVRVRQALNLAIDRWGGSQSLSQIAIAKRVGAYAIPGHPLAMTDAELQQLPGYGRDAEKAKDQARRLLRQAGVPDGFAFKLTNRNTEQPYKYVAAYLIDQWRQVGLNAEEVLFDTGPYYKMLAQDPPTFDVAMDFNCQAMVNPTADIQTFISKDRTDANHGHYIDRKLDALYDQQLREPNFARQKKIFNEFERYLNDQAYFLTTLWWNRITLQSARVQGWYITPSHYLNQQLETVWLKP